MYGREEKLIEVFNGSYKNGILGKKNGVTLYVYEKHMEGKAAAYWEGKFCECDCETRYECIKTIEEKYVNGSECVVMEYMAKQGKGLFVTDSNTTTVYFPNLENRESVVGCIERIRKAANEALQIERQREWERKARREIEERQYKEECSRYFQKCYDFHIAANGNPYYELQKDELFFACIYIDKDKNLNFLRVDGMNQEESNACIPYEKIHYYERAGSIHYLSDINGTFTSFGGRIAGGGVSPKAVLLGGLLFGPMGMAAGAVLTHSPAQMEILQNSFEISSQVKEIDDRSVILNYFSDQKRQYIDIELPADMYNFLQTHLAGKKYDIVLEIEKKNAVTQHARDEHVQDEPKSIPQNTVHELCDISLEDFQNKVRKLKYMYDGGLLTEEEFAAEKTKLLSQL